MTEPVRRSEAPALAARSAVASGRMLTTLRERGFLVVLLVAVAVGLAGLVTLIVQALVEGLPRLNLDLITNFPSGRPEQAGLQSPIMGTIWIMAGVVAFVVPLGVGAAIYLEEFADEKPAWAPLWLLRAQRFVNNAIEINIQNLAAVPSIIFGILGLAFFVRGPLSLGRAVLAGSLTLTLLVLPTVIIAAREAIRAVPASIREGSMALGATRWQTVRRQVLPAAIPGIVTGTILALSRAIGETAPLLLIGAFTFVTFNPDGLDSAFTAVPIQIYNWVAQPQEEFKVLAAAGIIVLLGLLLAMNAGAIWLRSRYQRRW